MGDEKKVVLITGCAKGGIGYEYCKAFAALGCRVIASDLPGRLPDMSDLLQSSPSVQLVELDVSSDDSVASAIATHGRVDVLVNNAGLASIGPLAELPLSEVRRAWEVNALGQLRLVQAVVPAMVSRRSGRIVNVGSVVGTAATPWAGSYCASKAWVHAASDALRVELRPFGVHVIKVLPGAVRSNLGRAATARPGWGREWEVYKGFKAVIEERAIASQVEGSTEAAALARHVAARVMRPRPPRQIVYGHMTWLFAGLTWAPLWARDRFFAGRFGLEKPV